jgi:hypothetical protein
LSQLFIALFGLTAMYLALGNNERARRWAPILGLCAQPFWVHATLSAGQFGIFVLSIAYTLVYVNEIRVHWWRRSP